MNSPQATVILKSPDGSWTSVGTEAHRGIVAEGISLSANSSGPDTCSFSLRREASVSWPDLLAFNQADVLIGGQLVWGGRIWEAPLNDGDEDVISVNGRGWQYHLDDDQLDTFWVKEGIGQYIDIRSVDSVPLSLWYPAATIVGDPSGAVTMTFPVGPVLPAGGLAGLYVDLGPNRLPGRIVVDYEVGQNAGITWMHLRASALSDWGGSPTGSIAFDQDFNTLGSGPATIAGNFATGARLVQFWMYYVGGAAAIAEPGYWVRLNRVRLFSDPAYESGGESILKASDVARDVLASGALPLLDSSTALIGTTSFSIPELYPAGYQTPRSLIAAANAYEGNLFGVDAERRLFLRERDEVPLVEVGHWPGSQFQDASTNSAESLYNKVIVQGTGPAGEPISEARTATSGLLNRQGFTRTATLSVDATVTAAGAQQIGDIWLAEKHTPPLKGSLSLQGWGAARYVAGGDVHPSEMLLRYGQRIRLGQLVDPATGDQGRDGIIVSVSYSHDTETATVELDSERGRFETLLSRLSVVTSQVR